MDDTKNKLNRGHTWLASYPKSGNTWFRFIIFHLTYKRMPENSRELDSFMNSKLSGMDGSPRYIKTHAYPDALKAYEEKTRAAIYIFRHPLDVMQSALNYEKLNGSIRTDSDVDKWVEDYIAFGGNKAWFDPPFNTGSWCNNVQGWRKVNSFPVLFISYESALTDTINTIKKVASFLEIPVSEQDIYNCAEETSFNELKDFENVELVEAVSENKTLGRFSTNERRESFQKGFRFFNKGCAGSYRSTFSEDQIMKAWEKFSPIAKDYYSLG